MIALYLNKDVNYIIIHNVNLKKEKTETRQRGQKRNNVLELTVGSW